MNFTGLMRYAEHRHPEEKTLGNLGLPSTKNFKMLSSRAGTMPIPMSGTGSKVNGKELHDPSNASEACCALGVTALGWASPMTI